MVPVRSFLKHFDIPFIIRGERNSYNNEYRTILYRCVSFFYWILLVPLKVLDLFGFYYLVDFIRGLLISKRKLTDFEQMEARKVFGDALNLDNVKISENSWLAKLGAKISNKSHMGFVFFRTVNFTRPLDHAVGNMDMAWLIHELVHVIQFNHLGVQYIFEALRAQNNGGYTYGGLSQLKKSKHLAEFNLEQQADIARHYYNALNAQSKDVEILKPFVQEINSGKF